MKRLIIKAIIFVSFGFLLGEITFGNTQKMIKKLKKLDTYYFLQEGVYSTKDSLQNNIQNLNYKLINQEDNKYYVYVGITKRKEVVERLKSIYEKKGYSLFVKEKELSSEEFSENVNQFDLLILDTEEEEQVLTIERVVLANYEEIIKKQ